MITYTVELKSDSQIGSGLGGEFVNSYVTRDSEGNPVIRASHIKGVLLQALKDIFTGLGWDTLVIGETLGSPGWRPGAVAVDRQSSGTGHESQFKFSDAVLEPAGPNSPSVTRLISRTAIDPQSGTASPRSLRTQEAVAVGCRFRGRVVGDSSASADVLLRLGLASIRAVGGGRNRGSGSCVITIDGEERSPGDLLKEFYRLLSAAPAPAPAAPAARVREAGTGVAWFDVVFSAEHSVLCPERPETLDTLRSGMAIPASAVQGLILHRLNNLNPEIADRCFCDPRFRAWPLHPCGHRGDAVEDLPWPVRVSITHKTAKVLSDPPVPQSEFSDEAIEPYDWENRPPNAPILKSCDGVLLAMGDGPVRLWKSGDMPRMFSTHGVHNDPAREGGRNLYSVEAMGALIWRGVLACPEEYAALLREALDAQDVSLGKARSVRGTGKLHLRPCPAGTAPWEAQQGASRTFIAQSPIALPDGPAGSADGHDLRPLVERWAMAHHLGGIEEIWDTVGLQFGWNRHGKAGAQPHGRVPATRVVLPGTVIKLRSGASPAALRAALLEGVGGGRDRGFGCLLPHPGKASGLLKRGPQVVELPPNPRKGAIQRAFSFSKQSRLSASQIGALRGRLASGRQAAEEFLQKQRQRGSKHWSAWESGIKTLSDWVRGDQGDAQLSLDVLRDLLDRKGDSDD